MNFSQRCPLYLYQPCFTIKDTILVQVIGHKTPMKFPLPPSGASKRTNPEIIQTTEGYETEPIRTIYDGSIASSLDSPPARPSPQGL